MKAIHRKKYTIHVSEVDFSQKLKLSSLFLYLQDMATEHAEILDVGRNRMKNYGVIWVLIRAKVDVTRYPKWNEDIFVETWPQQPNKIEFERNFIVYDSDENIIARAITSWVIIDINSRKLKRSSLINPNFPLVEREKALNCELGKFKSKGNLEPTYKKVVGYSDIDINEHLNNSRYIDYIMDCFSIEKHKNYFIKSIEINYLHEALPGDSLTMYTELSEIDDKIIYIDGINDETNKNIFKSQIEIQSIK
nr:acyl-ACP thioesterase domain-containing protein [Sedimentibacter sp.]